MRNTLMPYMDHSTRSYFLLGALAARVTGATQSTSYLQATWIPTNYNNISEESYSAMIANLHAEGVRRIYVDVWNQGKVYFASNTMSELIGESGIAEDHLQWALNAARPYGIEVYAWFEYGLIAAYLDVQSSDFSKYAQQQGWIIGTYSNFIWMDPGNADVVNFLGGIMEDCIRSYGGANGLKGVQLDDHFGSPTSLGSSASTMTNAMLTIRNRLNSVSLEHVLSLSPATLDTAKSYNVYWDNWGVLNYYDEVIPQLYRSTYDSFKSEFDYTSDNISFETKIKWVGAGTRVDGSGEPTPWVDVNNMIWYSNANKIGAAVWYAHGIIELYPEQFKNIWAN